ncbi:MAG: hypothetical protein ACI9H6_000500 [Patiriisocius sp.]|jgi:hypothetical protein
MENPHGASFIPKSPVRGAVKPRGVRRVYILTYVAFICFIGALLAAAAIFFYDLSINGQIEAQKEQLVQEQISFSQSDLEHVRDLEHRMNEAYAILDKHVSVHAVLTALEDVTLQTVQLIEFEYTKEPGGALILAVSSKMPDFNTALFQREVLSGNAVLAGSEIAEITYGDVTVESEDPLLPTFEETELIFILKKELIRSDIRYTPPVLQEFAVDTDDVQIGAEMEVDAESDGFDGFELEGFFDLPDTEVEVNE